MTELSTIITAIATAFIAGAAFLTWLVYRRIADLAAATNEVLERTNEISREMVRETTRNRESQFAPVVVPLPYDPQGKSTQPVTRPMDDKLESEWFLQNVGRGIAINIVAYPELRDGTTYSRATLVPGETSHLDLHVIHGPLQGAELMLTVRYSDAFGNRFESVYNKGRLDFRTLGTDRGTPPTSRERIRKNAAGRAGPTNSPQVPADDRNLSS